MKRYRAFAALAVVLSGAVSATSMAIEQPEYSVVATTDEYEIRVYEPYIVAETVVDGDLRGSGSAAFRRLAGYIFGKNDASQKMAMTAPVETRRSDDQNTMMLTETDGETTFAYAFVI